MPNIQSEARPHPVLVNPCVVPNQNGILRALISEQRRSRPDDFISRELEDLAVHLKVIEAFDTAMDIAKHKGLFRNGRKIGLNELADQYNKQIQPRSRNLFVEHFNEDNYPANPHIKITAKARLEHNQIKFNFERLGPRLES